MVFQLVHSVTGDSEIQTKKYKSSETGLTVAIAQVPGPIVRGFITLATEAHDDQGIPHTLEHLCFMGSEDYPYKGVLDILANRCLSEGTNAFTDTDNTCYTLSTAGPDGFLNLLPIFLDHVLYPKLHDSHYITEVHHINGKGEDGGVVYCEMQAIENSGPDKCCRELLRELYPGNCGYKSCTGGMLKDIRDSLNNEKIRKYHASFYRPENICICITGQVSDEAVLSSLSKFEEKVIEKRKKNPPEPFTRPWQSPVPPLEASVTKDVEYPCDDDDSGMIFMGWRGPSCMTDFQSSISISILFSYLNESAVSPLQQAFVELEDPYCCDISLNIIENSISCMYLCFVSIPKEKFNLIQPRLFQVLKAVASSPQEFDLDRMKSIIHRKKMQILSALENSPHQHVFGAVVGAFLYGQVETDLDVRLNTISFIEQLFEKDAHFWCELLEKYFISSHCVTIIGKPSVELRKSIAEEEKTRVEERMNKLGLSKLAEKAKELDEAQAFNSIPPPPEMLRDVPIPSTENISFYSIRRFTAENTPEIDAAKIPFKFVVDDFKTNFVTCRVLLNSSQSDDGPLNLDGRTRLYMMLLCQLITESAINRDGNLISYQEVVTQLNNETVAYGVNFGLTGRFVQLVTLVFQVEREKYLKGIQWLHELIFETVFEEERISIVVKRLLNSLIPCKRNGHKVMGDLVENLLFDSRCNLWSFVTHRQINFLKEVESLLKKNPSEVIDTLNKLRNSLSSNENLIVHMSMNLEKTMEANPNIDLYRPWIDVFLPKKIRNSLPNQVVTRPLTKTSELIVFPQSKDEMGVIAGVGSLDSVYMQACVKLSISPLDDDLPLLLVLVEYLTQLEGPLWREIRGPGLAYAYAIVPNVHMQLLRFDIFKSTQVDEAYKMAKNIVESHCKNEAEWDEKLLESARASCIFRLVSKENTLQKVSIELLAHHLLNVDLDHKHKLIIKIAHVTLDDLIRVAPIYLAKLFDDGEAIVRSVVCNTSKVDQVKENFEQIGIKLKTVDLENEEYFSYKV